MGGQKKKSAFIRSFFTKNSSVMPFLLLYSRPPPKHPWVCRAEPILIWVPSQPPDGAGGWGPLHTSPGSFHLNLRPQASSTLCLSSLSILLSGYSSEQPPQSNPTFPYIQGWEGLAPRASPTAKLFLSQWYPYKDDSDTAMANWQWKMGARSWQFSIHL